MRYPSFASLQGQDGSALISVLSVIVIFTVLAGTILSVDMVQHRFIHRDVDRLQAFYQAEAGVYAGMSLLRMHPYLQMTDSVLTVVDGMTSTVSIEAVGGYYYVRAKAGERQNEVTLRARVGERPPPALDRAVYLWDPTSRLNVAGATRIVGPIDVGMRGVRQSSLAGVRYTGVLEGVSSYDPDIEPPYFDDGILKRSLSRYDALLAGHITEATVPRSDVPEELLLPHELPVITLDSDVFISSADSVLLSTSAIVIAQGNMHIAGPLSFAKGTHFLAGGELRLQGTVTGEDGVFYGRQRLLTEGPTYSSGQFFSRGHMAIQDSAYVAYPSLLFLGGLVEEQSGAIEVSGRAHVEGNLIHGRYQEPARDVRGRIIVRDSALVVGSIYNPYETELHGTVYGSVITHQFYFYRSPTRYINWLFDAEVYRALRPRAFHVPLLFHRTPALQVLSWDIDHRYKTRVREDTTA